MPAYDGGQPRICSDLYLMGDRNFASCLVIDPAAQFMAQEIRDVLYERAFAIDVQTLQSVTNREYGLARSLGVLQQERINLFAQGIGGSGVG